MSIIDKIRSMIQKESFLLKWICRIYNCMQFGNKLKIRGKYQFDYTFIKNTKLTAWGENNIVMVRPGSRLNQCHIYIAGNRNQVLIDDFCSLNQVEIWIEGDHNLVHIGEHTSFAGKTHLACIEGTKIVVGCDCMFSANITIRTGDSHSITDLEGKRINPSKSVEIGNHVWVGNTVIITKGVVVGNDSVIGTGRVVTRRLEQDNVAIAGNSAKVVKGGICWDRKRLPLE